MTLDEKAEAWIKEYSKKHPWIPKIIEDYGLDLSLYNLSEDSQYAQSFNPKSPNMANFMEDVNFLKAFDEFVKPKLPQNFSNVLDVGVGQWNYVHALGTFFRRYKKETIIVGIDIRPENISLAAESVMIRGVQNVEVVTDDIRYWSRSHDIIVNLCPNLINPDTIMYETGIIPAKHFFESIWRKMSQDGLLILGLNVPNEPMERGIETLLSPFFKDISINNNPYFTTKSVYPITNLVTAKPKLHQELPQS